MCIRDSSIPFACDITGLLPKYFTILRGQIVVAILAWAIVPWKFLTDAAKFLTFLGSYSIFVGPILGCMLADYYFVKRGNIHVPVSYTHLDVYKRQHHEFFQHREPLRDMLESAE